MHFSALPAVALFAVTVSAATSCTPDACQSRLRAVTTHTSLCHSFTETLRGSSAVPKTLSACSQNPHKLSSACSCVVPAKTTTTTTTTATSHKPSTTTTTTQKVASTTTQTTTTTSKPPPPKSTSTTTSAQKITSTKATTKSTTPSGSTSLTSTTGSTLTTSKQQPTHSSTTQNSPTSTPTATTISTTSRPSTTTPAPVSAVTNVLNNGNFAQTDPSAAGGIANWLALGASQLVFGNGYTGDGSTDNGAVQLVTSASNTPSRRWWRRQTDYTPAGVEQWLADMNLLSSYTVNVWYYIDYTLSANSNPSNCKLDAYYGDVLFGSTGNFAANAGQQSEWTLFSSSFTPATGDGSLRLSLDCVSGTATALIDEVFVSDLIVPGEEPDNISLIFTLPATTATGAAPTYTTTTTTNVPPFPTPSSSVASDSAESSSVPTTTLPSSTTSTTTDTTAAAATTSLMPPGCQYFGDGQYWNPSAGVCMLGGDLLANAPEPILTMDMSDPSMFPPCFDGNLLLFCASTCTQNPDCQIFSFANSQECKLYAAPGSAVYSEHDSSQTWYIERTCFGCSTNTCFMDSSVATTTTSTTMMTTTTTTPAATTATPTPSSSCDAVNPNSLISNLSFEDLDGDGNEVDWSIPSSWKVDNSRAYDGQYSLSTVASMSSTSFSQEISGLQVGVTYRMNFWYQYVVTPVDGNTYGDYCVFQAYLGDQALFYGILFNDYYKTSTWTQAWSYGAVPSSSTELLNCTFYCEATYGALSTAYIDELVLGPELTVPYTSCAANTSPTTTPSSIPSSTPSATTSTPDSSSSTGSAACATPTWTRPSASACSSLVPHPSPPADAVCGVAGGGIGDVYEPSDPYYWSYDACALGCAVSSTCASFAYFGVCQFSDKPFYWSTSGTNWGQGGNGELWYDNECFLCAGAEPACADQQASSPTTTTVPLTTTTPLTSTTTSAASTNAACATPTAVITDDVTCGLQGSATNANAVTGYEPVGGITLAQCAGLCLQASQCNSFSFARSGGACYLWTGSTDQLALTYYVPGATRFYDAGCFSCGASGEVSATPSALPSASTPSATPPPASLVDLPPSEPTYPPSTEQGASPTYPWEYGPSSTDY